MILFHFVVIVVVSSFVCVSSIFYPRSGCWNRIFGKYKKMANSFYFQQTPQANIEPGI